MDKKKLLESVLDEQEATYINQFYLNEKMREAVRKVLLLPLYGQGTLKKGEEARPNVNWLYNALNNANENLGAVIRAKIEAFSLIEEGFKLLSSFQENKVEQIKKGNQAR